MDPDFLEIRNYNVARTEIEDSRTWLLDSGGWVLADSGADSGSELGPDAAHGKQRATWLQRFLYRMVAGSRTELLENWPADPVRLNDEVVSRALAGAEAVSWTQDIDTAVVWNTVAVPVVLEDSIHGAIVMQSTSDGLLLVTNRALGRLLSPPTSTCGISSQSDRNGIARLIGC